MKKRFLLTGIILLTVISLTACSPQTTMESDTTFDFVVSAGIPTILYKGDLYQYHSDCEWKLLEDTGKVKQIVTAEDLQYLDVNGKLHIEEYMTSMEEEMEAAYKEGWNFPSGAGHNYYLAAKALEANEQYAFEWINGHAPNGLMALLSDKRILYHDLEGFQTYDFDEEIVMLSDEKILTKSGNIYRFVLEEPKPLKYEVNMQRIYDGGDAVYINGWSGFLAGITKEGRAILWSRYDTPDISDWENLTSIVHGNSFVAALTNENKVLYKHYDDEVSLQVEELVSEWTNIVGIASYFDNIYAIDKEGNCYGVEMKGLAYGSDDWEVKKLDFEDAVDFSYEPLQVDLEGLSVTDYLSLYAADSFETPYVSLGPVEGLSYVYHRKENTYQENAYWDSVSIYYQGVRCGYFVTQDLYPMPMQGVTNWQSELGLEVIMESMGFRGAADLQEHVSVGDMERYYYAGGKQAYVYGDTEWLVEEGFLNSIEEALDEKVEEAAILYGQDHSTEGYLLRLYKSMISEEKIAALLEAITFKEGAFNVENMDIVLAHKDGVPSIETTQRDVWSYENRDKMAYYIALGDLTYRVPQGTVAILRDQSWYDLYVYTHDGTGGIRIGTIYAGALQEGMTAGSEVWEEALFMEEQQKILAERDDTSGLIKQSRKYMRETFVTADGAGAIQVERMIFEPPYVAEHITKKR